MWGVPTVGVRTVGTSTSGRARVVAGVVAGVCALLGLTACGGGEDSPGPGLEEAFGLPADDDLDIGVEQRRIEEAVAECMAGEGFEYEPAAPEPEAVEFREEDPIESARRDGFGVSLAYGNPEYDTDFGGVEMEDPNAEYVAALSESEAAAYYDALYGTPEENAEYQTAETDPGTGQVTIVGSGVAGCLGEAQREVTGNWAAVFPLLQPLWEEIDARVRADPRIVELEAEYASCMADTGFDFATPNEVDDYVNGDLAAEAAEVLGFDPNEDPITNLLSPEEQGAFVEGTDEEIDARYEELEEQMRQVPGVDREALAALHEKERSLAVAEAECSADFDEKQAEVYREIEAQFVRDNTDRIAELAGEVGN